MNPALSAWHNPPPPGTDFAPEEEDGSCSKAHKSSNMDPYVKNPDYMEYEKYTRERTRRHRRSRSRSKHSEKRKSRNSDRRRRSGSRSHSRSHRHRRHHSTSGSPSSSRHKHSRSRRDKKYKRSHSRSRKTRSRSHSRSKSHRNRRHSRGRYSASRDYQKSGSVENEDPLNTSGEMDEDDEPQSKENAFKNDGSFLEMFKKMQEEKDKAAEAQKEQAGGNDDIKQTLPSFGKRRGGRILKTGLVEKTKLLDEIEQSEALDPWSVYMKEVKRYKEACCDDDSKTRPLVK